MSIISAVHELVASFISINTKMRPRVIGGPGPTGATDRANLARDFVVFSGNSDRGDTGWSGELIVLWVWLIS